MSSAHQVLPCDYPGCPGGVSYAPGRLTRGKDRSWGIFHLFLDKIHLFLDKIHGISQNLNLLPGKAERQRKRQRLVTRRYIGTPDEVSYPARRQHAR